MQDPRPRVHPDFNSERSGRVYVATIISNYKVKKQNEFKNNGGISVWIIGSQYQNV